MNPIIYALAAYALWGVLPLYWKYLSAVDAFQIMSCRIVFSLVFVWVVLAFRGAATWPRLLRDRKNFGALLLSSLLIGVNWLIYIGAVNSGHTVQASLGYYINPLVNVVLGMVFFKERLPRLQGAAFALAAAGVVVLAVFSGGLPWISLLLALSFALYGMAKKTVKIDPLSALAAETLLLLPVAAVILVVRHLQGAGAFAGPPLRSVVLVASGIITALPLYWFALGARRLPLSTLGFLQFVSPTMQLLSGVFLFGEAFPVRNLIAFGLVWAGLLLYLLSYFRDPWPST